MSCIETIRHSLTKFPLPFVPQCPTFVRQPPQSPLSGGRQRADSTTCPPDKGGRGVQEGQHPTLWRKPRLEQRIHFLGIGFASGTFHGLADQEPDHRFFPSSILGHLSGMLLDDRIDQGQ